MLTETTTNAINLVRQRISEAVPGGFDGRAVLLFSGGRDSSAVGGCFCKAFPRSQLHLLLFDNGLLSRLDSPKRQAALLKELAPETDVIFEMKRVSQMMRYVGMQQVEKDFTKMKFSTLLICLACKLVMNVSAAYYAKELGIKVILDGYAERQKEFPEQTDEFIGFIRKFYAESGLTYISPLYNTLTDKGIVSQILGELGFYIPKQEAVCMWADSFSTANPQEILAYIEKTMSLIRQADPMLHC